MNIDNERYKELIKQRAEISKEIADIESNFTETELVKVTFYAVALHCDHDDIKTWLENSDYCSHIAEMKSVDILWHDDIDINMMDATTADYEKYFERRNMK